MRTIKDEQDLKKYIYNLERENESLKKSHSYRLGKSLINIKDKLLEKNVKSLIPASKNLLAATKKAQKSPSHVAIDIEKINNSMFKSQAKSVAETKSSVNQDSIQHYFTPNIKYKKVIGTFSKTSGIKNGDCANILLTPDNYKEVIGKSNIDFLVFDLQSLKDNPLWFAFGTHDAIFLLRNLVMIVGKHPSIVKVLIENEDITLFPLFMKLKELGFFDVTQNGKCLP